MITYKRNISTVRRLGQIAWSLLKHLSEIRNGPVYWRKVIDDLGGGIIKLAQILAMRYDLLPVRFCKEFVNLFDRVTPISPDEIRFIFQEEFGVNPEELFGKFDYSPYATASFGQVHCAWIKDQKVAVKVQKLGARATVTADIALLTFFAKILRKLFMAPVDLVDAIHEWESWTRKELDYELEASSAERLRETNSNPETYIPRVFRKYSTSRILVTEFLEGVSLSEIVRKNIPLSQSEREKIARGAVWTLLLHYFKGGFFHADPHLGNLIYMKDGRLGLVDFGIVGEVKNNPRSFHFARFIKCASEGEVENSASHFREFMSGSMQRSKFLNISLKWRGKSADKIEKGITNYLEDKFQAVIKLWARHVADTEGNLKDRSSARHFLSMVTLARRFGLTIPLHLITFIRAIVIGDMVCLVINPRYNAQKEMALLFKRYPELCAAPEPEKMVTQKSLLNKSSAPAINFDKEAEGELEEKQKFIERYVEYASQTLERILEEGSRGIAYFATTKL